MISRYKWVFYGIAVLLMLIGAWSLFRGYNGVGNVAYFANNNQTTTANVVLNATEALSGSISGAFLFITGAILLVYAKLSIKFERLAKR